MFTRMRPSAYGSPLFKVCRTLGLDQSAAAKRLGYKSRETVSNLQARHRIPKEFEQRMRYFDMAREAITVLTERANEHKAAGETEIAESLLSDVSDIQRTLPEEGN